MKIGYIRVSSIDQNTSRQEEQLAQMGIDKYFIDKASGKDFDRPAFNELRSFVRQGDTVIVTDWSRLGRSTMEVISVIDDFKIMILELFP